MVHIFNKNAQLSIKKYAVDLIVVGEVEKVEEDNYERLISVKIITLYKGKVGHKNIIISSPLSDGECGIYPRQGNIWLFFAQSADKDKTSHTNSCTRTTILKYNDEFIQNDDIPFLENKLNPKKANQEEILHCFYSRRNAQMMVLFCMGLGLLITALVGWLIPKTYFR